MGFNSAFKGLKLLKTPGNGRLNNLNDPVLNVLAQCKSTFLPRNQKYILWPHLSLCISLQLLMHVNYLYKASTDTDVFKEY